MCELCDDEFHTHYENLPRLWYINETDFYDVARKKIPDITWSEAYEDWLEVQGQMMKDLWYDRLS